MGFGQIVWRRRRCRCFEPLEERWMLTRTLSLASPEIIFAPDEGYTIAAHEFGDLDDDADKDLVVVQEAADQTSQVVIMVQDEAGQFQRLGQLDVDFAVRDITLADVNQDSMLDVALQARSGFVLQLIPISVDPAGVSFHEPLRFQSDELPKEYCSLCDYTIEDLNSDGMVDLVFAGRSASNRSLTYVFLADEGGSFQPPVRYNGFGNTADIDNNGTPDLVVAIDYDSPFEDSAQRWGGCL